MLTTEGTAGRRARGALSLGSFRDKASLRGRAGRLGEQLPFLSQDSRAFAALLRSNRFGV